MQPRRANRTHRIGLPRRDRFRRAPLLAGVAVLLLGAARLRAAELTVFAAASLTDALKEAAADYEKRSSDKIVFNFGASSLLARQIGEGAPADIFFSADEARMDVLEKEGLIAKETRKDRLSNSLVIVTAADSKIKITSPADLAGPDVKRLALADPKTVPAGVYAKTFLEKQKLWAAVEPRIVPTDNVRAALAAVESGNVDAGVVFKTDAAISKEVKVVYEVPARDGPEIRYPLAAVKDSMQIEAARQFLQYLASDEAGKIFEKHGFIVLR